MCRLFSTTFWSGLKSKPQCMPLNYTDKCIFKCSCFVLNQTKHITFDFPVCYSSLMSFIIMVLHHDKIDDIQVLKYYVMHQHKNVTQERNAEPLSL